MTTVQIKDHESFESALRRFRRNVDRTGLIKEIIARESYEKPTTERKRKRAAAIKRHYKRVRADQLPTKKY